MSKLLRQMQNYKQGNESLEPYLHFNTIEKFSLRFRSNGIFHSSFITGRNFFANFTLFRKKKLIATLSKVKLRIFWFFFFGDGKIVILECRRRRRRRKFSCWRECRSSTVPRKARIKCLAVRKIAETLWQI